MAILEAYRYIYINAKHDADQRGDRQMPWVRVQLVFSCSAHGPAHSRSSAGPATSTSSDVRPGCQPIAAPVLAAVSPVVGPA